MLQRVAEIVLPITEFAILTGCCIWIYDTKLPYRNIVGYFIFAFCLCFAIRIVKGKWWEDKQKHADNLQNELDILQSKYADLENKYKEVIKE